MEDTATAIILLTKTRDPCLLSRSLGNNPDHFESLEHTFDYQGMKVESTRLITNEGKNHNVVRATRWCSYTKYANTGFNTVEWASIYSNIVGLLYTVILI